MNIPLYSNAPTFVKIIMRLFFWYLVILSILVFNQKNFLIFPSKLTEDNLAKKAASYDIELWKDHQALVYTPKPSVVKKGIVLFYHGNAGFAGSRSAVGERLRSLGFITVLAEYPEFGAKAGKFVFEDVNKDALNLAIDALNKWPNMPLYVASESLGTGPASFVIKELGDNVKSATLFVPYSELAQVAQNKFWMFPVRPFFRYNWNVFENLKETKIPINIVVAQRDEVIGAEQGLMLYSQLSQKRGPDSSINLIKLPEATHNAWFDYSVGVGNGELLEPLFK